MPEGRAHAAVHLDVKFIHDTYLIGRPSWRSRLACPSDQIEAARMQNLALGKEDWNVQYAELTGMMTGLSLGFRATPVSR